MADTYKNKDVFHKRVFGSVEELSQTAFCFDLVSGRNERGVDNEDDDKAGSTPGTSPEGKAKLEERMRTCGKQNAVMRTRCFRVESCEW